MNAVGTQVTPSPAPSVRLPVNSYDDFTALEEIVVGYPFHLSYAADVSARLFYPNVPPEKWERPALGTALGPTAHERVREEMWEDLDDFVALLLAAGVRVRRPELIAEPTPIRTPDWESVAGHCQMIRDTVLAIGNELIETPPLVRSRYFETSTYQGLLQDYFDAGAKWTVAPRPRLREESFDFGFVRGLGWTGPVPEPGRYEIMFDAAQVLRLGRDLVFNCSLENHRLGARWLARHLGDAFRVHPVTTGIDDHIDCAVIALRPGTLLVHEDIDVDRLPSALAGWDVIRHLPDEHPADAHGLPVLGSPAVFMNVLSLDEERVIVEASETRLAAALEGRGFTPIPCRWRHGRLIGGGFHCMTLDVRRRGALEDYLGA